MNAIDYNAQMQKIIDGLGKNKPKLLIHACCAPCSTACLERLKDHFNITVLFYNPNVEDGEYLKRKQEIIKFLSQTGWAEIFDCEHGQENFYAAVRGLEHCAEGGERCTACFKLRLERTAKEAAAQGVDYFATTLTLSPLKDAKRINEIGYALAEVYGVKWLPSDFKKKNGYLRSLQLSKEYSLYRQNYCGCVFSRTNA
ncbi:MAG: epoxyqueuosine reductase QueH [Clostridia bacterium]|nr:epoxyqueuosine reductase QueH [Clostridia bacterium]